MAASALPSSSPSSPSPSPSLPPPSSSPNSSRAMSSPPSAPDSPPHLDDLDEIHHFTVPAPSPVVSSSPPLSATTDRMLNLPTQPTQSPPAPTLLSVAFNQNQVLELGCGNSQLCEELCKDGITELTCIDLSAVAVEKMKQRLTSKGYREIRALVADMLDLPFGDECFDVVVEKGTMDVLFVDSGDPWNPRPETVNKVMSMLQQVHRVLKPDGIFISITFGQPHFRRPFFKAPEFTWSIDWKTFGDGFHYFLYILKKGQRSSEKEEFIEKIDMPTVSLYHEELDTEDFIFRTNIDGM